MMDRARTACFLALTVAVAACGSGNGNGNGKEDSGTYLRAWTRWMTMPGSTAEIGYYIDVDIHWRDRKPCEGEFANLRLTINDREAPPLGPVVDCDLLTRFRAIGFHEDGPVTMRLFDGEQAIGEASFDDVFPGRHPQMVTPIDGHITAGTSLTAVLPPDYRGDLLGYLTAEFYWLELPSGVPPFYTSSPVEALPDGRSVRTTAPDQPGLTGRAAVVFLLAPLPLGPTTSCLGFTDCSNTIDGVLGPIEVTVVAAGVSGG